MARIQENLERYRRITGSSPLECPACGELAMVTVADWRSGEEPPPT